MNFTGKGAENLVPGSVHLQGVKPNLVHGAFSKTRLPLTAEESREVEELLALPHTVSPDRAAAEEVVRLRSIIGGLDVRIEQRLRAGSEPTKLIELRTRMSGRLLTYLEAFGLTPKSRATWTQAISPSKTRERTLAIINAPASSGFDGTALIKQALVAAAERGENISIQDAIRAVEAVARRVPDLGIDRDMLEEVATLPPQKLLERTRQLEEALRDLDDDTRRHGGRSELPTGAG